MKSGEKHYNRIESLGEPILTSRGWYYPPTSGVLIDAATGSVLLAHDDDEFTIPIQRGAPRPYDPDISPPQVPALPPLPNQDGDKASQAFDVDDGAEAGLKGNGRRSTPSGIDDIARGLASPPYRKESGKKKRTSSPPQPEIEFVGPPAPVSIRTLSGEEAEKKRSEERKKFLKNITGKVWDWLTGPDWDPEEESKGNAVTGRRG